MGATSGQRIANCSKEVLQEMSDQSFRLFYETVLLKKKNYPSISESTVPRKRLAPIRGTVILCDIRRSLEPHILRGS